MRLISLDTETSGLDPKENDVLSIGAVDLETGKEFYKAEWVEIFELYEWWKNVGSTFDSCPDYATIKQDHPQDWYWIINDREDKFEKELIEKMKRLCELKGMLWT